MLVSVICAFSQSKFGDDSDGVAKAKGSKKYGFNITYVNGTTRLVSSTIDINYCMRTMFLEDSEKEEAIYPAETQFIETILNDGTVMRGTPRDSFWVFQIHTGKLNTYSTLPNNKIKDIEYIEKDGEWMDVSEENFRTSFSDNAEALALFEKSIRKRKTSKALGMIAGPLAIAGFFKDGSVIIISYAHVATIGTVAAHMFFKRASKKRMEEAIETYNK